MTAEPIVAVGDEAVGRVRERGPMSAIRPVVVPAHIVDGDRAQ